MNRVRVRLSLACVVSLCIVSPLRAQTVFDSRVGLPEFTADAEQVSASIRTRAQEEAQVLKENATKEIHSAQREAIRQVHEQAAVLSTRVAEKILRRNLNVDDQRELVRESLEQLQTVKA